MNSAQPAQNSGGGIRYPLMNYVLVKYFQPFFKICFLGYLIFIIHKIAFCVAILAEIKVFQSLNYQLGHLMAQP